MGERRLGKRRHDDRRRAGTEQVGLGYATIGRVDDKRDIVVAESPDVLDIMDLRRRGTP